MDDDEVEIQFPPTIFGMVKKFLERRGELIGWCLPCDSPITTETDLISGTTTHNCEKGRAMEADARAARERQRLSPIEDHTRIEIEDPAGAKQSATPHRCRSRRRTRGNHDE